MDLKSLEKSFEFHQESLNGLVSALKVKGVTGFNYSENDMFGRSTILSTDSEYLLKTFHQNFHRGCVSFKSPKKFKDATLALSLFPPASLDFYKLQEAYKFDNCGVGLIRRYKDNVRMYFFRCKLEDENQLLDNEVMLEEFVTEFHEKESKSLDFSRENGIQTLEIKSAKSPKGILTFSPQQKECLDYLTKGLSAKEIAQVMGLSTHTVFFYLKLMKEKAGAQNLPQMVAQYYETRR